MNELQTTSTNTGVAVEIETLPSIDVVPIDERVEAHWKTEAGLYAVAYRTNLGHLCGYVSVPCFHPLYGVFGSDKTIYLPRKPDPVVGSFWIRLIAWFKSLFAERIPQSPEEVFDVHGGITWAEGSQTYPIASDRVWWFGFDCAHYNDAPDLSKADSSIAQMLGRIHRGGTVRTLDFVKEQCESLAMQIVCMTEPESLWEIFVRKTKSKIHDLRNRTPDVHEES